MFLNMFTVLIFREVRDLGVAHGNPRRVAVAEVREAMRREVMGEDGRGNFQF